VIAKNLSEIMAGKIDVESNSKGTCFTLSIPFKDFGILDELPRTSESETSYKRAILKYR
jgi:alpha-L-fucosidase